MAHGFNRQKAFKVGTATFMMAPAGTDLPTDLLAPGPEWEVLGYTEHENTMQFDSEDGSTEYLKANQDEQFFADSDSGSESMTFKLLQWSDDTLKLYYGSNAIVTADGGIAKHESPAPTEGRFTVVFNTVNGIIAWDAPASDVIGAAVPDVPQRGSLAMLPLRVTPRKHAQNNWTAQWISKLGITG